MNEGVVDSMNVEVWLESSPAIDPLLSSKENIVLDGLIVRAPADRIRLVTNELCLDFDRASVVHIEEVKPPNGVNTKLAAAVRVFLQRGARILDISPSEFYRNLLYEGQQPFAVATRPSKIQALPSPIFLELEREKESPASLSG